MLQCACAVVVALCLVPGPRFVQAGIVYKTVHVNGTGEIPQPNETVVVHYTGMLTDGTKFDSSRDRGQEFSFKLGAGEVIAGWDAGVSTMRVGERSTLQIAPEDGYGPEGNPPVIPPSATLLFDIELIRIDNPNRPVAMQQPPRPGNILDLSGVPMDRGQFTGTGQFSAGQTNTRGFVGGQSGLDNDNILGQLDMFGRPRSNPNPGMTSFSGGQGVSRGQSGMTGSMPSMTGMSDNMASAMTGGRTDGMTGMTDMASGMTRGTGFQGTADMAGGFRGMAGGVTGSVQGMAGGVQGMTGDTQGMRGNMATGSSGGIQGVAGFAPNTNNMAPEMAGGVGGMPFGPTARTPPVGMGGSFRDLPQGSRGELTAGVGAGMAGRDFGRTSQNLAGGMFGGQPQSMTGGSFTGRQSQGMTGGSFTGQSQGMTGGSFTGQPQSMTGGSFTGQSQGMTGGSFTGQSQGMTGGSFTGQSQGMTGGQFRGQPQVAEGLVRGRGGLRPGGVRALGRAGASPMRGTSRFVRPDRRVRGMGPVVGPSGVPGLMPGMVPRLPGPPFMVRPGFMPMPGMLGPTMMPFMGPQFRRRRIRL